MCRRTCSLDPARSRNALGSGTTAPWPSRPCSELRELFTLPLGVDVFVCGWGPGRPLSLSRGGPFGGAAWGPGPCEEVISRVAEGSALLCCLFFLPNRNDMAPGVQPWGRYNGSRCRSRTHSVCTGGGQRAGEACLGCARARYVLAWIEVGEAGRRARREVRGATSRCSAAAGRRECACLGSRGGRTTANWGGRGSGNVWGAAAWSAALRSG